AVVDVEQFEADVPVGPGSAIASSDGGVVITRVKPRAPALGAVQALSQRLTYSRTESPHHYPDNDLVSVTQVAAWVADAPAYGIASYAIDDSGGGTGRARATRPNDRVAVDRSSVENA